MERILLNKFKGRIPRLASKLLPEYHAQVATNCDLRSGSLKPLKALNQGASMSSSPISVSKIGTELVYFDTDCNFVRSMVGTTDKLFVTGNGYPKQYTEALYPADHRRLGIVPPSQTLTITFGTIGGVTSTEVSTTVSYVYTYVSTWGEESSPSPATPAIDVQDNQYVTLTNFEAPTVGNKNDIEYIRIYRLAAGSLGAEYHFLEEVDELTTTYDDYDAGAQDLNAVQDEVLQTEYWVQPPDTLSGLIQYANGMLAGFDGNELYLSEPFYPYAWPLKYVLTFDSAIVGIAAFNEAIIVITETKPYIVSGTHPDVMTQSPVPVLQGCVSKRGIVETSIGVIYPSPDGLIIVDGAAATNITKDIITKEDWLALGPDDLSSFWYDGQYFGFFDGSDTGFTITADAWVDIDLGGGTVEGGYVSPEDDKLYLIMDRGTSYIEAFNDHATTKLSYIWKSGAVDMTFPSSYSCGKIYGALGSVSLIVYGDGSVLASPSITSQNMFRLPGISRYWDYEVYLTGQVEIESVVLAVSPQHLLMD